MSEIREKRKVGRPKKIRIEQEFHPEVFDKMVESNAEAIIQVMIDQALAGNNEMIKLFLCYYIGTPVLTSRHPRRKDSIKAMNKQDFKESLEDIQVIFDEAREKNIDLRSMFTIDKN